MRLRGYENERSSSRYQDTIVHALFPAVHVDFPRVQYKPPMQLNIVARAADIKLH